jgi:hypothetical protein
MSCAKLREVKMAKECAEAGCNFKVLSLNLCSKHYQKFNRNLKPPKPPKEIKICTAQDCNIPAKCKGYCKRHYKTFVFSVKKRLAKPAKKIKICNAQDCDLPIKCKGYCKRHYKTFVSAPKARLAQPAKTEKPVKTKNVCDVSDCNSPAVCKGYCAKHYVRFKKHGNTGVNYNRKALNESGIKRKSQYMKKSSEKTLLRSQEETEVLTEFFSNLGCVDIIDRDICEKY